MSPVRVSRDPDEQHRQPTQLDVSADAVLAVVVDRAQPEAALAVAPAAFHGEQLLVAGGQVLGGQRQVGGAQQPLAVVVGFPLRRRRGRCATARPWCAAPAFAARACPSGSRPARRAKALAADAVAALLTALGADPSPRRRTDWMQRDRALILTALLAGLRADELMRANVGDLRRTDDGAVVRVRGKGGKTAGSPSSRRWSTSSSASRHPGRPLRRGQRRSSRPGIGAWPAAAPLFVDADGERITRGTLQCRVLQAFGRAGVDADRAPDVAACADSRSLYYVVRRGTSFIVAEFACGSEEAGQEKPGWCASGGSIRRHGAGHRPSGSGCRRR